MSFKLKENLYFFAIISGILLDLAFFTENIYTELIALFALTPLFYQILKEKSTSKIYFAGMLFFSSWLIPTTYWYYLIFPWWQALLQSFGFVSLMATLFILPNLFFKKEQIIAKLLTINLSWTFLTTIRILAPGTKDWWIPDIFYTQWLNPLIIQVTRIGGVSTLLLTILLINSILAYLFLKKKDKTAIFMIVVILFSCLLGNIILKNTLNQEGKELRILTVQAQLINGPNTKATHEDVLKLKRITEQNLKEEILLVLWPENLIEEDEDQFLKEFVKEKKIYVVYNRKEKNKEEFPFNTAVILDPRGEFVLTTYKKHKAPQEKITTKNVFSSLMIEGIKVTTDICYDLHYADVSQRTKGNDLLFALVDDARYGEFLPSLHAADVVFRATENRINIVTAATTGPTFFVNKYGVVLKKPIKIGKEEAQSITVKI